MLFFFQVVQKSEALRVRTTVINMIQASEIDKLNYLKILEIEANHELVYLEPGIFRNLSNLEQLSISYNTRLRTIDEKLFIGLKKLRNLTMVNNGFINIADITITLQPKYLPSLRRVDLSENIFGSISKNAFTIMEGTELNSLKIALCQIDLIDVNSFLPLKKLKELHIGQNDLDSITIEKFIIKMTERGINLVHLDLSSMGFKKYLPRMLLSAIANSTIKRLILAQNKFETIIDDSFPIMPNIELLDLRKVSTVSIGPNAFNPEKFPNLIALLLGGNNLPGIHAKHLSTQLKLLDISHNPGNPSSPVYFEITKDTFLESRHLQVLNLSHNRIKSIFDYTFRGLNELKILSLENGTLFHIGPGTFMSTKNLHMLNLANNPLMANENLTKTQFEGLDSLEILILSKCGIKDIYEDNNMFEAMPNITHLMLNDNQLIYLREDIFVPLKNLEVLDLSGNLLIAWWKPLFATHGIQPKQILVGNNKITHFSLGMLQDMDYLLQNNKEMLSLELMDNVFVCDCNNMYIAYTWLQVNGSVILKEYFENSNFQCSAPDMWEKRKIADYFVSIQNIECVMYEKISNLMLLVWTLPSLFIIVFLLVTIVMIYRYRIYIRYWLFLAKVALGRTFIRKSLRANINTNKIHKYDAFVSYCNEDRDFVLEIVSELEMKPPYLKLCIYERDFEIGSFISESIMSSINDSRYILLIISNNFAKSQWCRWETQLAEYHRLFLSDGSYWDPLVLVRIGEVESKYMTPTLKYLMKTKIYLAWSDQGEMFWAKLRKVLAKDR